MINCIYPLITRSLSSFLDLPFRICNWFLSRRLWRSITKLSRGPHNVGETNNLKLVSFLMRKSVIISCSITMLFLNHSYFFKVEYKLRNTVILDNDKPNKGSYSNDHTARKGRETLFYYSGFAYVKGRSTNFM